MAIVAAFLPCLSVAPVVALSAVRARVGSLSIVAVASVWLIERANDHPLSRGDARVTSRGSVPWQPRADRASQRPGESAVAPGGATVPNRGSSPPRWRWAGLHRYAIAQVAEQGLRWGLHVVTPFGSRRRRDQRLRQGCKSLQVRSAPMPQSTISSSLRALRGTSSSRTRRSSHQQRILWRSPAPGEAGSEDRLRLIRPGGEPRRRHRHC